MRVAFSARSAAEGGGVSLFRLFDPSTGAALPQPEAVTPALLRSQQAADDYGTYIMLEPATGKVGPRPPPPPSSHPPDSTDALCAFV